MQSLNRRCSWIDATAERRGEVLRWPFTDKFWVLSINGIAVRQRDEDQTLLSHWHGMVFIPHAYRRNLVCSSLPDCSSLLMGDVQERWPVNISIIDANQFAMKTMRRNSTMPANMLTVRIRWNLLTRHIFIKRQSVCQWHVHQYSYQTRPRLHIGKDLFEKYPKRTSMTLFSRAIWKCVWAIGSFWWRTSTEAWAYGSRWWTVLLRWHRMGKACNYNQNIRSLFNGYVTWLLSSKILHLYEYSKPF